ncbi:ATP-binding cassette domain-containing protein [Streptomyces sp. NBC_00513]|uniref:ATP-binding cassette domain-containing protein n=1 Tax=unclassified Streptomyces TaxID=2593676 RepID=UPI00224F5B2A|nr:ATP-binding cassette domain-containing protein [Streptomyces sp. NBC_00424]MCX5070992.1 ATP-binding cassette domain-containing protein [Streptomyces sp. NBC_00424]WUD45573.1 ATP-binding cassette domain-containing protein [Streptomyces sp. NBC_00513]
MTGPRRTPTDPPPVQPAAGSVGVQQVAERFGAVQTLGGVTLDFPGGQITVLMGENGVGKSTRLKILTSDHQPTDGHVVLEGQRVDLDSPDRVRAAYIRIIPHVSVAENVHAGALPHTGTKRLERTGLRRRTTADLKRREPCPIRNAKRHSPQMSPTR